MVEQQKKQVDKAEEQQHVDLKVNSGIKIKCAGNSKFHFLSGDVEEDSRRAGEGAEAVPGEFEAGDEASEARGRADAQGQAERGAQGQEGKAGTRAAHQGKYKNQIFKIQCALETIFFRVILLSSENIDSQLIENPRILCAIGIK